MSTLTKQERTGAGLAAGSMLLVGGSVAASSALAGYPVLGGQAVRYLAAGLLLAAWARLTRTPLPRPAGRDWAWLAALAAIGLAGCSAAMIQATRAADPASVGIVIGAAPLVLIIAAAIATRRRPTRRVLLAAAMVTAGSAAAQLGGATGPTFSAPGLLWSAGALGGVVGTSLLAGPVLPRLGALAVTAYACDLAGLMLLAAATVARSAGGPPILRTPTPAQLAALAYLTLAVTALVFIAWYGAIERLGVDRTGLFNGLIPVTSLAAVALTGTGAITPVRLLAVLAGVILGLSRAPGSRGLREPGPTMAPSLPPGPQHLVTAVPPGPVPPPHRPQRDGQVARASGIRQRPSSAAAAAG
jgi:drug/metabolite transporter (DMT)-like permease